MKRKVDTILLCVFVIQCSILSATSFVSSSFAMTDFSSFPARDVHMRKAAGLTMARRRGQREIEWISEEESGELGEGEKRWEMQLDCRYGAIRTSSFAVYPTYPPSSSLPSILFASHLYVRSSPLGSSRRTPAGFSGTTCKAWVFVGERA